MLSVLSSKWNRNLGRKKQSPSRATRTLWVGMISVSLALSQVSAITLRDNGYEATASRGVPVYFPAFAGFHMSRCIRKPAGGVGSAASGCARLSVGFDWSSGVRRLDDPKAGGDAWYQRSVLLRRLLPTSYNDVFSRRPALLSDAELKLHRRDKLNRAAFRVNSVCLRPVAGALMPYYFDRLAVVARTETSSTGRLWQPIEQCRGREGTAATHIESGGDSGLSAQRRLCPGTGM